MKSRIAVFLLLACLVLAVAGLVEVLGTLPARDDNRLRVGISMKVDGETIVDHSNSSSEGYVQGGGFIGAWTGPKSPYVIEFRVRWIR